MGLLVAVAHEPPLRQLNLGRYQCLFSFYSVEAYTPLFPALTSLSLAYAKGTQLMPDWCCPPGLRRLEVTA